MSSDVKMTASEIMQSYCVKVNDGSGVLVNAMTHDYSYVLTALHVVKNTDKHVVTHHLGHNLKVLEVLTALGTEDHPYDCAILKVDYQESIEQNCIPISKLQIRSDLVFVGFPKTERESSDQIKHYDGHLTSMSKELFIFTIDGVPGKNTIEGMSGGGVYHLDGDVPLLLGIEFQMDGTGRDQQYGRVQCYSLDKFDQIITAHGSAQMIPAYLECFSRMRDSIFSFNVIDLDNVRHLKKELKNLADLLIASGMPPPYKIMEEYDKQLLVDPLRLSELKNRELWVAYLEFLVICALMDNVGTIDDSYLKSIERRRRLLYTNDDRNWISHLESLLKIARDLLDKDGSLIVASPEAAAKPLPQDFLLNRVIENIASIPSQGPFTIDLAERSIYQSFKLTHLEGLRRSCVIDREYEFNQLPDGIEQLRLFRDKLNEIIN